MNPARMPICLLSALVLVSPVAGMADETEIPTPDDLPAITPGRAITLAEALRLADERNLSIAAARADILRAQAELKRSWAVLVPVASGTATFTHYDHADVVDIGGGQVEISKQQDLRGSLLVSAPLIHAEAWQGIVLGDLGVDVAELSAQQVRQTMLLSVAQAYYQALAARSLLEIQRNQIQSSQRHLAVATIRHRSGTGQRLDVIRAQTELLSAREALLGAHTALDNTRDALAILIGQESRDGRSGKSGELPMPAEETDLRPPEEPTDELLAQATRQREDLKLARAMVELADSQLTLSWMQFVPSIAASWQLNHQFSELRQFGSQDATRWFIGLTLSVPIFDETRYADLDQKRASLHKARLDAEYAEWNARLEVRQARRSFTTAVEQVATARKKAELATQALELAETAYENGTGTSLDVTDARRSSRAAEIDLATRRFDAQLALLVLFRSVGEDMRTLGETGLP